MASRRSETHYNMGDAKDLPPMFTVQTLRNSQWFLVFLGGLVALTPLSIDAYLPAMPDMAGHFATDFTSVNLTLTLYVLGSAAGQFFGGALSDHLGRRPLGLLGLLVFVLASLLIAVATSIQQVWLLRVLQALGGGVASVICMAQVRDIFTAEEVPVKIANIILIMLLAPMLAPLIGAVLLQLGWESIFLFLALYAGFFLLIYFFGIPETGAAHGGQPRKLSWRSLGAGYLAVLRQRRNGRRIALRLILFSACSSGIFMCYLTNAAFIYMQYFGLNEFEFSALFAAGSLTMMGGNRGAVWLLRRRPPLRVLSLVNGLHIAALTLGLACVLLLDSPWVSMASLLLVVGISGAVAPTAAGFYMSLFMENSGTAASLKTTLMFSFGSLIGALAALLSAGELLPIFAVMLAAGCLGRLVLPKPHTFVRE